MASNENIPLKAIGSLHSFSPIPDTEGICLVLDRYRKLLSVDRALVTVQAGMKLRDLNEALAELGLALPTLGTITEQTVSGAISTATHGGSIYHGSLSDCVESVRIVRSDGSVQDVDRSQDLFHAVVVSIGLLGIISTVTFRCVPAFVLRSKSSVMTAQHVVDRFDDINRGSPYTDILYFPVSDEMEVLSIERADNGAVETITARGQARLQKRPWWVSTRVGRRVIAFGLQTVARLILLNVPVQRWLTAFSVGSSYRSGTGRSDRVLAFSDLGASGRSPGILQDMELAVPYEQGPAAISVLRQYFSTTRRYPLLPIHIRCSARSDSWLSPTYKRDVCWLEFWQFPRSDMWLTQIHELLEPFQYRFHWGKDTPADREYIRKQYEKWDDFVQLRQAWDAKGVFLNSYTKALFYDNGLEVRPPATGPT